MRAGLEIDEPQTIESYLRHLENALSGPAGWKRRVLAETEDGLLCEIEDSPSEREVIRRWGPVDLVAADFNESGNVLRARRMAWQILQWMPILIVGWALVVELSPDPWPSEPALIRFVAPVLFACVAAAVTGSVQLVRRSATARPQPWGIVSACSGVGLGILCLAVLLGFRLDASRWHIFWPAALVSAALTLGVLATVIGNARHLVKPILGRAGSRFPADS